MTERIYYTDAMCLEFEAIVITCETVEGRHVAVLDRTAFYPTSGGQPNDLGRLGDADVLDVFDREDGTIGHVLSAPVSAGTAVRGRIDAIRRIDHMQQHTGQHILSAAFDRLFQARTVGFHLGAERSTLDLDKVLNADSIARAEAEANRVVWENRTVSIRVADADEAARMPLRKESARTGPLRLVDVADFDLSACGGTHVARAGEVGMVAVRTWEKLRGGLRLEFVCGARALREFRTLRDAVTGSLAFLSVAPADLPAAIERQQGDNKDLRRTIRDLQERLAVHEAVALVARATVAGAVRVVVEAIDGWDQAGLKTMAAAAAAQPGIVAALLTTTEPAQLVVARSGDVPLDASAVVKAMHAACGGKGGGKPELAQGGGLTGGTAPLLAQLRQIIERSFLPAA